MRLAIFLTVGLPLAAIAQPGNFEFNGISLGITQAQFVERFPLVDCRKQEKTRLADISCGGVREIVCRSVPRAVSNCGEQLVKDYTYEGVDVLAINVHFYSDVLSRLSVYFKPDDFDRVVRALSARYGKPSHSATTPFRTPAGAIHENAAVGWSGSGGSMLLVRKYAGVNLMQAQALYDSESARAEFKRRGK